MLHYVEAMWHSFFPHECVFPLQMAGRADTPIESEAQLVAHLQRFLLLFTYRTGFEGIQTTTGVIHSDQGWGCLLRTSQMLLAHFLKLHVAPQSTDRNDEAAAAAATGALVSLFADERVEAAPFSIQNMIASVWDRNAFKAAYWSPSQGCEAIRRTVDAAMRSGALPHPVAVVTSSNGCLVAEDVVMALRSAATAVLLLVPVRAGVSARLTQEAYLQLCGVMSHPSSLGLVGGVPGKSYYFFAHSQTQLLYLDPHQNTQPALRVGADASQRGTVVPSMADVRCVEWSRVDTSLFMAFGLRTLEDWEGVRARLSTVTFLSVEDRRSLGDYALQREQRHRGQAFMSPLHSSGIGVPAPEHRITAITAGATMAADAEGDEWESGQLQPQQQSRGKRIGGGGGPDADGWEVMSDFES